MPVFLGNTSDPHQSEEAKTKSMILTAGIVVAINLFCYLGFRKYKSVKKDKKYTSLDVDFRKFQDKYEESKVKQGRLFQELDPANYGKPASYL